MLALVGFAVGYVVGVQQGREGMERLVSSWHYIRESEEFAGVIESGKAMAGDLLRQAIHAGTGMVTGEVKNVVNRRLQAA